VRHRKLFIRGDGYVRTEKLSRTLLRDVSMMRAFCAPTHKHMAVTAQKAKLLLNSRRVVRHLCL
jgi:hypothetical protein